MLYEITTSSGLSMIRKKVSEGNSFSRFKKAFIKFIQYFSAGQKITFPKKISIFQHEIFIFRIVIILK